MRRLSTLVKAGVGAGGAVAALVALLLVLGRRPGHEMVASVAGTDARPAVQQSADPLDAPPLSELTIGRGQDTAIPSAPLAAVPSSTLPVTEQPASSATAQPRTPAARSNPGSRDTRWSLDWVNIREGRGVASAIVTVLKPGVEVQVADQRGGWWAVYVDGSFVGYASGSLFGVTPPADTPT